VVASTDSLLEGVDISARPVFLNGVETPLSVTYTRRCYWPNCCRTRRARP
jgi:hypothetical protein